MKFPVFIFFLFISFFGFSQNSEKKILFKGDSLWYAGEKQILFSSSDKGLNWDTVFGKRNPSDTVFFYGAFDTTSNIFISDQKTIFVFGWDGTMHYKTVLYCSSDCGKSWSKKQFQGINGVVGVKYLHKVSSNQFFLDCRKGRYAVTVDSGKTWTTGRIAEDKNGCCDDQFTFDSKGAARYGYFTDKDCRERVVMISFDGGLTWSEAVKTGY